MKKKAGVPVTLTPPPVTPPSHKVHFNLERDDGLALTARDEKGELWYILRVESDGRLYRYEGVPDDIGFQTDNHGRVVLKGE